MSNENLNICSKCGGECCKLFPGFYYPDDFRKRNGSLDWERILNLLTSGLAQIDRWEDTEPVYFLRPKMVMKNDSHNGIFSYPWGGDPCIHLTEYGCSLKYKQRPSQCRLLDPVKCEKGDQQDSDLGRESAMREWKRLSNKLQDIGKEAGRRRDVTTKGHSGPQEVAL